jgi:hypothetical protein
MKTTRTWPLAALLLPAACAGPDRGKEKTLAATEERAVSYLAAEVPRWPRENRCFSCHNSGDGARALYAARAAGVEVPDEALAATSTWLRDPGSWNADPRYRDYGDPEFTSLQFASALIAGTAARAVAGRAAVERAGEIAAKGQLPDGSWRGGSEGTVGSPTAYSQHLATYAGARILAAAGAEHDAARERAVAWLRERAPANVHQAAVLLLGASPQGDFPGEERLAECLALIRQGASPGGGWGAYANAAPEAFDTALVLLGLARLKARVAAGTRAEDRERAAEIAPWIESGREFLRRTQRADGSWQETTRPPGAESYALRISTTAWAVIALLATR